MENKNYVKGFKVFNPDWTCNTSGKPYQYKVGETFEEDVTPKVGKRGFHFCENAVDCFKYSSFDPQNKVAEVIALGDIDSTKRKSCTNKIQIVREISWQELLEIVNTGKACTGFSNSGDQNSGNWNSGNRNSGIRNSGYYNSGNWNSGNWNSGNYNSGDCNSGNQNSGDWNKCDFSGGCFNTESQKIYLFNKPSEWTYRDWRESEARVLLDQIPFDDLDYIWLSEMTAEEKAAHPEALTTGGYLKPISVKNEERQEWWDGLPDSDKNTIKSIPNFDADIFFEITGIKAD